MRQAVAASAVSGAADASLEATSVTPEHGQSLVLEAADSVDSDDADEGAMLAAHESTELSPGVGAATASNDSPLEWRRPLKVEIVTGWGKRSRVQGASLVKAGVEAVLLRELRAPFSVHRFHPGSYEADGADLEAWLLTPGVDQVLAPRDSG
ncbi:hypothetical protein CLOM_g1090 [Closterium sp. NIES-68]|nr:hypothetical protein CLOM_g1090 [Closterium sp. NIES-68]